MELNTNYLHREVFNPNYRPNAPHPEAATDYIFESPYPQNPDPDPIVVTSDYQNNTTTLYVPADPSDPDSEEIELVLSGIVLEANAH